MPVIQADRSHIQPILEMSREFWLHTQFTEPFDSDHTEIMVQKCLADGLLAVAVDKMQVLGFIGAIKSPLLCSPKSLMACEAGWYVKPEKRGKLYGIQLIQLLECLAVQQEVKYLNLVYMETSMPEKVKTLYESLGYKKQETSYTKVLHGGNSNRDRDRPVGRGELLRGGKTG